MAANKPKNDDVRHEQIGGETYELASISSRLVALIIDSIIMGIVSSILAGITSRGELGFVTYFFLQTAYQWYFLLYRNGQTPGKSATHVRVVKADGTAITGADALLRSLGYTLNGVVLGLGWFWALFDAHYQGLHDKLAKTYVIKTE
jgi:uncharacterized RDD family membrane protein YckC